jgi:ATPase family protein associated with various cellular activities (AAA)
MNRNPALNHDQLDIFTFSLAGLSHLAAGCSSLDPGVAERLAGAQSATVTNGASLLSAFKKSLQTPVEHDYPIVEIARQFSLTLVEILCLRLTMAAEEDLEVGHAIAQLQTPVAGHRPTVGLMAHAFGESMGVRGVQVIGHGAAVRHGILVVGAEDIPLSERQLSVPLPTCLALQGVLAPWAGTRSLELSIPVPLGQESESYLERVGQQLAESNHPELIVIRSGEPIESRAAVLHLCRAFQSPPVLIETETVPGLAPWLFIHGAVPVFHLQMGPGDRRPAPHVPNFPGPTIVITGTDGEFESDGRRITDWRIPTPARQQRFELWKQYVPDPLARVLACEHRHSAARIATLGREIGRLQPNGDLAMEDVQIATRKVPSGLRALAEIVPDEVSDSALVVPPELSHELEDFVLRCRLRDGLAEGFGAALQARYRPGVRALLVGPSGTGKTLAASWIATRLGSPLFRVDLSAISSKYIGETEKNLSQLLSRAEENEIVLLFDEADSLFGKRTEVRDAHDRFANAQTNFLLQRLENYDGIVLLTSNSRARFDSAFARRLDVILEFPFPGPEERRALWLAHLGESHTLTPAEINHVAVVAEISGGQIRNAVLSAAIHASSHGGAIRFADLAAGLLVEYRKLGRQLPEDLKSSRLTSVA